MKGSILDLPFVVAALMLLGVSIFVSYTILYEIDADGTFDLWNESADVIDEGVAAMSLFDSGFVLIAIGLGLSVILTAFMINTHPVFFVLSWIMLVMMIFISAMLTNAFDKFATSTMMAGALGNFPILTEFFRNMPLFCLIIGSLVAIVMYARGGYTVM